MERSGFIHNIRTAEKEIHIQLYIPIVEKIEKLILRLPENDSGSVVLLALIRDALALSLPVTCEVESTIGEDLWEGGIPTYFLKNVEIKTRKTYHQAGWSISNGEYIDTGQKQIDWILGKVDYISIGTYGLISDSNNDLPDTAQIGFIDSNGKRVELYLGLQRADLNTNMAILSTLNHAFKNDFDIGIGYYLAPLYRDDSTFIKWIHWVRIFKSTTLEIPFPFPHRQPR